VSKVNLCGLTAANLAHSSTPTIRMISEYAGVSKSTVSLALRNSSKIQKKTCLKIQAIAQEMNYRPNPLVSAQMVHIRRNSRSKSTPTIGFLSLFDGKSESGRFTSRGARKYYLGAKARAAELGFTVDLLEFDRTRFSDRRLQEILHSRCIEGLILAPCSLSTEDLKLNWDEYTLSAIGCFSSMSNLHRFFHDSFACLQDVMNLLARRAYNRIGFVSNEREEAQMGYLLSGGYLEYQSRLIPEDSRIPLLLLANVESHWSRKDDLRVSDWFELNKPDVVISSGVDLRNHIRSLGLRMPEDIGYVTVGRSGDVPGDCAGYDLREEKIGALAIDSTVARLYRNERGLPASPSTVLICGEFIEGSTLGRATDLTSLLRTG
jgi:LacI family transcriptional regulator